MTRDLCDKLKANQPTGLSWYSPLQTPGTNAQLGSHAGRRAVSTHPGRTARRGEDATTERRVEAPGGWNAQPPLGAPPGLRGLTDRAS